MTLHLLFPTPSISCQDPGPQPLELKQVFALFQIQYNRSYSNPEGIMGHVHLWSHSPFPFNR